MALTLAIVNQKGGVGKTSLAFHLAGAWAAAGYDVLAVDVDPQHALTEGLLGVAAAEALQPAETAATLYDERLVPGPGLIRPTALPNLSLVPAGDALRRHNAGDYLVAGFAPLALRDFLTDVPADIILIDCPSNFQLLTWSALAAASWLLVPFPPDQFSCRGAVAVERFLAEAQAQVNPALRLAGFCLNLVKRTALHRAYEQVLRDSHGAKVLTQSLPDAVHFAEAITERRPVTLYRPRSAAAKAVRGLAAEVLERLHFEVEADTAPIRRAA